MGGVDDDRTAAWPSPTTGGGMPVAPPAPLGQPAPPAVEDGHVPAPSRWKRVVAGLALVAFVGWTVAAFAAGLSVGTRQRIEPPPAQPDVVVSVVEVQVPDAPPDPGVGAEEVRMVNVLGLDADTARTVVGDAGFDPDLVTLREVPVAGEAGIVVAQDPVPGAREIESIVLDISTAVEVPADALGRPAVDVVADLETLGAIVRTVYEYRSGAAEDTVLAVDPATGPVPDEVVLTAATAPASYEIVDLEPIEYVGNRPGQEVDIDGRTGRTAMQGQIGHVFPEQEPSVVSVSYDLSRDFDSVSFVVGVTDDSDLTTAGVLEVVVDGVIVGEYPFAFGAATVVEEVPVTDALRLEFRARSTVPAPEDSGTTRLGDVVVVDAIGLGSPEAIDALVGL